jgi:hypothetical protein
LNHLRRINGGVFADDLADDSRNYRDYDSDNDSREYNVYQCHSRGNYEGHWLTCSPVALEPINQNKPMLLQILDSSIKLPHTQ